MSRMNPERREVAVLLLTERQKKFCDINGLIYNGTFCELKVKGGLIDVQSGEIRRVGKADIAAGGLYGEFEFDGKRCKGEWCVDHVDNNNSNNPADGRNWALICRGGNGRKNHRGATSKPKLYDFKDLKQSLKRVRNNKRGNERGDESVDVVIRFAEMEKNKAASPLFRKFISMAIAECGCMSKKDLLDAGAEYVTQVLGDGCGIDQQTAERYLKKLCAPIVGKFEIYDYNEDVKGAKASWWVRERKEQAHE